MSASPSQRAELIRIVGRIMTGDYAGEEEADRLVAEFRAAVPHPRAADLIFWPNDEFDHDPGPYPRFVDTVVDYAADGRVAAVLVS
ncbi:bacteriocin immunity protein [Kribbella sp. NPDC003505]|uniref:bacteriocin immunity protein n=1 Tax=Kribbella sp. NPDC003505 TaxID=3154448 RepID=UPI0033AF78CC